jgi:hypothetical protein
MRKSFATEAMNCRLRAQEFDGRPERPFLLQLAKAFEQLHLVQHERPSRQRPEKS